VDGPKASPIFAVGFECGDLLPPKRFACLMKCLFPRNTHVLERAIVIAFGDLARRASLAGARPPFDGLAHQDNQLFDLRPPITYGADQLDHSAGAQSAHGLYGHGWSSKLYSRPDRGPSPDGARSTGLQVLHAQSIFFPADFHS
jgi:hypothetical protein